MSVVFGPSTWWLKSKEAADYYARICPVGTVLGDGSAVWCRTLGQAWIIAPVCTQISDQWASGRYNTTLICGVGCSLCCICEWPNVCNRLVLCGFNPCDWFIPNNTILVNSYNCRSFWDTYCPQPYWSSSEASCCTACFIDSPFGFLSNPKTRIICVRSFRCITL